MTAVVAAGCDFEAKSVAARHAACLLGKKGFQTKRANRYSFMATLNGSCRCDRLLFEAKSVGARQAVGQLEN